MIISSSELVDKIRKDINEVDINKVAELQGQESCLIDIREPNEFAAGHVEGAVNMPRGVLEMQLGNHPLVAGQSNPLLKLAEKDIYLICRSGSRTVLAAESLQRMGFDKVYSVAGGMIAWEQAGLAVK